MSVGMLGYLAIGVNSSAGTASSSVATTEFIPFTSENLTVQREDLESQGIAAQWDSVKMFPGLQRIQGTVQMECHPLNLGYFLRMAFDQCTAFPPNANYFPAASGTATVHVFRCGQGQFQAGSGSDTPTTTIEIYRGPAIGQGSAFCYYGVTANVAEITCEAGQLTKASFDLIGIDYSRKARQTPTYQPFDQIFRWSQVSVSLGGAGSALFESFTCRVNNQLEAVPLLDGRTRPGLVKRNNFRTVELNGRASFQNDTDYDAFVGGSERQLQITFRQQDPPNAILRFDVPAFRYSTFPVAAQGPGRIVVDFTGRGVYHQGSGTSLEVCLVNTRTSPYIVNTNG